MHDSLAESRAVRNLGSARLRARARRASGSQLNEISTTASAAINEVRDIAYNLGPYN